MTNTIISILYKKYKNQNNQFLTQSNKDTSNYKPLSSKKNNESKL